MTAFEAEAFSSNGIGKSLAEHLIKSEIST